MTKLANFELISNYHDLSRIPRITIELYTLKDKLKDSKTYEFKRGTTKDQNGKHKIAILSTLTLNGLHRVSTSWFQ